MRHLIYFVVLFFLFSCSVNKARRAEVLYVGSSGLNLSNQATWLSVELFKSGVNLTYSDDLSSLAYSNLSKYDAVILSNSSDYLSPDYESSLKRFLGDGKGIVSLHFSVNSFSNSSWYRGLVRGGFKSLGSGESLVDGSNSSSLLHGQVSPFVVGDERFLFSEGLPRQAEVLLSSSFDGNTESSAWIVESHGGRFFCSVLGSHDGVWKTAGFLRTISSGIWWALGSKVQESVSSLHLPSVSIYSDSISDFTVRYDVPRMQEALAAEESMKLIQSPVDFDIKLFASEPDIVNPIAMSWDERGRLWVIESVDYPNSFEEVKGRGQDKIKICEDTDGDGVADKFTVFAEGLNIATSLTFANDGVIVAMAPDFVYFKDTDGDDVADYREVILSGWSKGDTHAGPSNLQYGFDNKIWGVTGYAGYNGIVDGRRQIFSQGLYRLNPDGSDLEYLATTSNNTWGLGMSEDNNVFISTANNTHSAFYSMPERFFQRKLDLGKSGSSVNAVQKIDGHYEVHALTPNLRQVDVVGGFTSAAGHQLYTARDYPENYWNRMAFVTEPTVRLVHNAIIEKDGAGFKERDGWNLLASSDEWFGPIHAEVGPDGSVWVLDWYNFIIQHNVFVPAQAPSEKVLPFTDQPHGVGNAFESNLRDKKHGRVYRVVYKGSKNNERYVLSKSDPDGLLKALNSTNKFWRTHAQRLLVERQNSDVQEALLTIIRDSSIDAIGLNAPAIHAIWTLQGLGLMDEPTVKEVVFGALRHPSGGVRKAAIQALPLTAANWPSIQSSGIFSDPDLNTRLAAFVKVAESSPLPAVSEVLVSSSLDTTNLEDRWLRAALFAAIQTNESSFVAQAGSVPANDFISGVVNTLGHEVYSMGRVSRMQFSPTVSAKAIFIETEVMRRNNESYNGMIIGQGDGDNGYALYMRDNTLFWDVYQDGQTYSLSSSAGVGDKFTIQALLSEEGGMSLFIGHQEVGRHADVGLFTIPLSSYVRSGHDLSESRLTDFRGSSEFIGNVSEIKLHLGPYAMHTHLAHGHHHGDGSMGSAVVVAESAPSEVIVIKAVKDIMQYDKRSFTVKAGQQITLIMENPDAMPHNLVIIKPGTNEIVGKAADHMLQFSSAAEKHYVPEIADVLFYTKIVNPGESYTLKFQAPSEKGDYPFLCTFPGHWRGMNGIMRVVD